MKKQTQSYILPILALVIAQVLWGINTPVIKLGLKSVPLAVYHSVTIMGAALLILPFALKTWKKLSLKGYTLLILGSVIAISLGNVALLLGIERTPSVNAPLIGLLQPLLLMVLSVLVLRERFSTKTLLGICAALLGAALVIGKPWDFSGTGATIALGNMFLILAVLCNVVGVLVSKKALKQADPYQVVFIQLFFGIIPVVIFATRYIPSLSVGSIGKTGFYAIVYNIIAVALANLLFMYALQRKKAQDAGIFTYLHPIVTAIAAWFVLAEKPSGKLILGALLIFIGIYLAEISGYRQRLKLSKRRKTVG